MGFFGSRNNNKEEVADEEYEIKEEIDEVKFRNVDWGVSKEKVEESEDSELIDTSRAGGYDILNYTDTLIGEDFLVCYYFGDDKLVTGGYGYNGRPLTDEEYIEKYHELFDLLKEKYGEPSIHTEANNAAQMRNLGLFGVSKWIGNNIVIDLMLNIQGGQPLVRILYSDKELEEEYQQSLEDASTEKI